MFYLARIMLLFMLVTAFTTPSPAAQTGKETSATAQKTLKNYVGLLKQKPSDVALRKKIISLVLTMKPRPALPENVELNMSRGFTYARNAAGAGGYNRAIVEFESAVNSAPWLAIAYYNLGVVQDKLGFYPEAIQSLKLYLMADPNATNAGNVETRISALESDVNDLNAGQSAVGSASYSERPASGEVTAADAKRTLLRDPKEELSVISLPPAKKEPIVQTKKKKTSILPQKRKTSIRNEKKKTVVRTEKKVTSIPSFIGSWFFKDSVRGKEITLQAFEISKTANGDIIATPPNRAADYVPTIRSFERTDKTMKIEIYWRMMSVLGYWKIELYDLTLSDDGTKLAGSFVEKSVGGNNIAQHRTLFRR